MLVSVHAGVVAGIVSVMTTAVLAAYLKVVAFSTTAGVAGLSTMVRFATLGVPLLSAKLNSVDGSPVPVFTILMPVTLLVMVHSAAGSVRGEAPPRSMIEGGTKNVAAV